jgi:hypothetical protein
LLCRADRAGSVTGGWEDGKLGKYAPKPENGDCYIMRDRADFYPAPGENVHSEYVVYNVDEEQVGEYVELCKRNGYTDDEYYNDITDDDYQVYWAGVSEDLQISPPRQQPLCSVSHLIRRGLPWKTTTAS